MPLIINTHHQKCTLNARALTPVHVGCGMEVGRWEYFFSKDDRLVYLDYEKLATEAVDNEDLIDQLTRAAASDPGGNLNRFLRSVESKDAGIRDRIGSLRGQRQLPNLVRSTPADERSIRRIRLFNGSPNCYIPGGSIKGALRTALLSTNIANSSSKEEMMPRDPSADDFTNLRMLRERMSKTFRPHTEETRFFQGLMVRDGKPIDASKMGIASIRMFGASKRSKQADQASSDEYAEVLLAGAELELEITLRLNRLQNSKLKDMREILDNADKFFRRVWAEERSNQNELTKQNKGNEDILHFYESASSLAPDDYYLLRIGYGAGQMTNSILIEYRDHYSRTMSKFADVPLRHGALYMRKRTDLKKRNPYPYTSRSAIAGEQEKWSPMGWMLLQKNL